jgi:hypothetical protein
VVRQAVSGPDGAYLVVLPTDPRRRNIGYFVPGVTPASGLRSVEYRDGSVCRIADPRRPGGARACQLKGFVPVKRPTLTHADLAAPVRVRLGTRPEHPGTGAGTRRRSLPPIPAQRRVTVSFRARHAADARSFYTVSIRIPRAGAGCGSNLLGPIARDLAAGTVVTQRYDVPYRCHGTLRIAVGYTQQRRPSQLPFDVGGFGNAKVGRVLVRLP